jgi:tRNA pseudouridine13 synthase
LSKNLKKGKELLLNLEEGISWKGLKWVEHFYIEAYLSYLWNRSLKQYLMNRFDGYLVKEGNLEFFIPYTNFEELFQNRKKFWSILGYKIKLDEDEKKYYSQILQYENLELEFVIEKLKGLKLKGNYRKYFLKAEDIKVRGDRIEFFIPKGGYATMFLKHIYLA